MTETFLRLNTVARRRAADEGLHAFTVEELCAEAGVSRRTFFNYFASKEDAVLGVSLREDHTADEERFVAATGALVDDLAELMVTRWELVQLPAAQTRELIRAFEREPRLLARLIRLGQDRELQDVALIERRQGGPDDTGRAVVLVQLLGTLLRISMQARLEADDGHSVRELFSHRLTLAREVFSA